MENALGFWLRICLSVSLIVSLSLIADVKSSNRRRRRRRRHRRRRHRRRRRPRRRVCVHTRVQISNFRIYRYKIFKLHI